MNIDIPGQTLKLNEFNINTLIRDEHGDFIHPRIVMIAPSGSGKSWVVRQILYTMRDIPCGTVVAPTDKMNKFYDDFIPLSFIHHEFKPSILYKVLDRQKKIIDKNEQRIKHGKKPLDPRAFFVMDDCMADKEKWIKDHNMLEIMNQGRHCQLTFILTMQYVLGIQPELRSQFNFVFLLGDDNILSIEKIWKNYGGIFPKLDLFQQIFNQVTQNYGCMVINNRIKSSDISKKVFWFKAKKIEPFKIGSELYIKYNKEHYDPEYEKKRQCFNIFDYGAKKKSNIIVRLVNTH